MGNAVAGQLHNFAVDPDKVGCGPNPAIRRWDQMMNIQIGFNAGALRGFNPSVRDRAGIATVTSPTSVLGSL